MRGVAVNRYGQDFRCSSIHKGAYMVSNQPLQPSHSYSLSFYAKGSGSGTRAVVTSGDRAAGRCPDLMLMY